MSRKLNEPVNIIKAIRVTSILIQYGFSVLHTKCLSFWSWAFSHCSHSYCCYILGTAECDALNTCKERPSETVRPSPHMHSSLSWDNKYTEFSERLGCCGTQPGGGCDSRSFILPSSVFCGNFLPLDVVRWHSWRPPWVEAYWSPVRVLLSYYSK